MWRLLRIGLAALLVVVQLLLLLGNGSTAIAAPCAQTSPAPMSVKPPSPNSSSDAPKPVALPATGGSGCDADPARCDTEYDATHATPTPVPSRAAIGGEPLQPSSLFFAGSAPGLGREHGTFLMLVPSRRLAQATCAPPTAPALPDPRTVAQGVSLPWPDLQIRAKPDNLGLTGLPSWFWIEGYTGGPVTASKHIHLDGLPNVQAGCPSGPGADEDVRVRAIPYAYDWHFGDNMPASSLATTSLGVPYPQREGAITHLYQTTSAGSGDPIGFAVVVIAHFRVQYQASAGWQTLTEVSRQATMAYKVAQAYPVIVH
jgi:hypothetical protein